MADRLAKLAEVCNLTSRERQTLEDSGAMTPARADKMIENVVGVHALPLGMGLNFLINGKDYLVPMAIEEPSVVASASHIAKIVRATGGFTASADHRTMIGQVQVVGCPDWAAAREAVLSHADDLIEMANAAEPGMVVRGGGAVRLQVRSVGRGVDAKYGRMLVIHLVVDTRDAMGANIINTMVERIAPDVEALTGGKVYLRILSNYTDECLARAECVIPPKLLATGKYPGVEVRDGVVAAYEFAASDVYRAVTHNKGVMNGIDAVVIATGNDWRAIEAAAHAYACRDGQYGSMTEWSVDDAGNLVGRLELPMPVGIVGGAMRVHPTARLALKILGVTSAAELAEVVVAVGLAQNLGALKALVTHGIQRGHMALHARSVAMAAGAEGELVDRIAEELVRIREIRVSKAKELLELLQ